MEDIKSIVAFGRRYNMTYAEVVKAIGDNRITLEAVIEKGGYEQKTDEIEDEYYIPPERLGICPVCGMKFEKLRSDQRYCCSYCYYEHQAQQKAERKHKAPAERVCAYCGKVFISTEVRRRKYCSERCAFMGKDVLLERYRQQKASERNGET